MLVCVCSFKKRKETKKEIDVIVVELLSVFSQLAILLLSPALTAAATGCLSCVAGKYLGYAHDQCVTEKPLHTWCNESLFCFDCDSTCFSCMDSSARGCVSCNASSEYK